MKKLLLVFLISSPLYAEIYSCVSGGSFINTFKRVVHSDSLEQFQYQVRNYSPELYSITRETDEYLYLMRDQNGGASHFIIGKKDNSFVGIFLKHKDSSGVWNGECFLVKE